MQKQLKTIKQLNREISSYLYRYFVTNTYAMAIQMENGKYITKYLPVSQFLIEEMLNQKGSVGCYQQCYKSNMLKWICFDFDCHEKDSPDLNNLFKKYVAPLLNILDEYKVNYLTEFSGRRGIHVWIVFSHLIQKEKAFHILTFFKNELMKKVKEFYDVSLDSFPATNSAKGNIVGKQVKMPLSSHRSGSRSWFFEGKFKIPDVENETLFLEQQLDILSRYKLNDYQNLCDSIGFSDDELIQRLKYKKYRIINDISLSIFETIDILSDLKIYKDIFQRMMQGHALREDWLVLLGTFSPLNDGGEFIKELFSIFPNYDIKKSTMNIKKYNESYHPATLEYLYKKYGIEMEEGIEKDDTGFIYLLKKMGIVSKVEEINNIAVRKEKIVSISDTVKKEIKYMMDNDEVLNVSIWNDLHNIKSLDLHRLEQIVNSLLESDKYDFCWEPQSYVYYREENKTRIRTLISLGAFDRILTTQIALVLQHKLKNFWNSYSYNVSFGSKTDIFYNWYSSWGEYINQIKTFLEVPFMENYEVFTIDLKGFYDHIDFLSVYSVFEKELDNVENNLFKFLIDYNEKLMRKQFNNRIGVPQGPAYARIIAEMYLDKILSKILSKFNKDNYYLYRYVDDIIVFSEPETDGKKIYDTLYNELISFGLSINEEKSQWYGSIKSCSDENRKKILRKDKFTYDLQDLDYKGYITLSERNKDIYNFLSNNEFDISNLGLFFNKRVYFEASEHVFKKYAVQIMKSKIGRGNGFRRFYEYVFTHSNMAEYVLDNNYLDLVPLNGVNFGNLLGEIYLLVQRKEINENVFVRIQTDYLCKIDKSNLTEEYCIMVEALLKIRYKVKVIC